MGLPCINIRKKRRKKRGNKGRSTKSPNESVANIVPLFLSSILVSNIGLHVFRLLKFPTTYFDKQKKNKKSPEYLPALYMNSARISPDFLYIGKIVWSNFRGVARLLRPRLDLPTEPYFILGLTKPFSLSDWRILFHFRINEPYFIEPGRGHAWKYFLLSRSHHLRSDHLRCHYPCRSPVTCEAF